jgi:hypothetical protein
MTTEQASPDQQHTFYIKLQGLEESDAKDVAIELQKAYASSDNHDVNVEFLLASLIRQKMSEKERLRKKSIYRDGYRKRPEVIAKTELKKKDPKHIASRKAYADKPEVKERKKLKGKQNSLIVKAAKEEVPELVTKIVGEEGWKRKKLSSKPRSRKPVKNCCQEATNGMEMDKPISVPCE